MPDTKSLGNVNSIQMEIKFLAKLFASGMKTNKYQSALAKLKWACHCTLHSFKKGKNAHSRLKSNLIVLLSYSFVHKSRHFSLPVPWGNSWKAHLCCGPWCPSNHPLASASQLHGLSHVGLSGVSTNRNVDRESDFICVFLQITELKSRHGALARILCAICSCCNQLSYSPSELPVLRRTHCSWRKAGLFVLSTRTLSGSASWLHWGSWMRVTSQSP